MACIYRWRIKKQFFVPKNFAHGFLVLSDYAEFCYKVTDFYHPNDEGGILWNDAELGVEWPMPEGMCAEELLLLYSDKDRLLGSFAAYKKAHGAAGLGENDGRKEKGRVAGWTPCCKQQGLIWNLAKNDIKKKFAGSYFGIVWAFVQPVNPRAAVLVCV